MFGQHHRLNGHEPEQTLRDSEGQGGLACCSPRGCKESDTTGERKLQGSKQPGVKTPLQVLPTILCKTKNSLTQRKKKDFKVDYTQLPAGPASG